VRGKFNDVYSSAPPFVPLKCALTSTILCSEPCQYELAGKKMDELFVQVKKFKAFLKLVNVRIKCLVYLVDRSSRVMSMI